MNNKYISSENVTTQVASEFYRYGHKNSTVEHSFQHKSASPPSHPEPNNPWTKVSCKRDRPAHEEARREPKHMKESEYGLHPTPTSNRFTALLEEANDQQQQKLGPGNTPNLHQST
jgi:hypothetical protein